MNSKETPKTVPQQEETVGKKKMSRGKAIKKTAGIALAAGTMLTLLNSKQALAYSGGDNFQASPAPASSGTNDFKTLEW